MIVSKLYNYIVSGKLECIRHKKVNRIEHFIQRCFTKNKYILNLVSLVLLHIGLYFKIEGVKFICCFVLIMEFFPSFSLAILPKRSLIQVSSNQIHYSISFLFKVIKRTSKFTLICILITLIQSWWIQRKVYPK